MIIMFMGEYNHTVDAKGRVIVPSRFREQLGDELVVTKGLDGCLFVYETTWFMASLDTKLVLIAFPNKFFLDSFITQMTNIYGIYTMPGNVLPI